MRSAVELSRLQGQCTAGHADSAAAHVDVVGEAPGFYRQGRQDRPAARLLARRRMLVLHGDEAAAGSGGGIFPFRLSRCPGGVSRTLRLSLDEMRRTLQRVDKSARRGE